LLLEKDGKNVDAVAFVDAAGVSLVVIQDKELTALYSHLAAIDLVPFFAGEDSLEGEAADMVIAIAFAAEGIEDDVVAAELAEVGLFVKSGGAMVGKRGKIHGIQN
jgi:hypothetical protein